MLLPPPLRCQHLIFNTIVVPVIPVQPNSWGLNSGSPLSFMTFHLPSPLIIAVDEYLSEDYALAVSLVLYYSKVDFIPSDIGTTIWIHDTHLINVLAHSSLIFFFNNWKLYTIIEPFKGCGDHGNNLWHLSPSAAHFSDFQSLSRPNSIIVVSACQMPNI